MNNTKTITPVSLFGNQSKPIRGSEVQSVVIDEVFQTPKNTQLEVLSEVPAKLVQENQLVQIDEQKIVLFGSERQREIGKSLDSLLVEITKGNSPILFELFSQLKKGVDETDVGQLEEDIRKSQGKSWYHPILDSIGLSSAAKRIQKANERIGGLLTSKSKSLLDLTKTMETNLQVEVQKLIADSKRLDSLAIEYRRNIQEFGNYVAAGKQILLQAQSVLAEKEKKAAQTNSPLDIEEVKNFRQKVDLFESRLVVLETVYAKAPVELEAIRISQGAALSTLGETANSALEEFNSIKSILIRLQLSQSIHSTQAINQERKNLLSKLENHGSNMLGQVAEKAAKDQGQNRIDDAKKLLDFANRLNTINDKVEAEKKLNVSRYAEARQSLQETKKLTEKIK